MSASVLPQFGKRNGDPQPLIVPAPEVSIEAGPSAQAINEIHSLCLSRLEPGAVAGMSSERLAGCSASSVTRSALRKQFLGSGHSHALGRDASTAARGSPQSVKIERSDGSDGRARSSRIFFSSALPLRLMKSLKTSPGFPSLA